MSLKIYCTLLCILISPIYGNNFDWINTLPTDINEYLKYGVQSDNLKIAFDLLKFRTPYKGQYKEIFDVKLNDILSDEERDPVWCDTCRSAVDTVLSWVANGDTREEIIDKWVQLCIDLGTSTPRVCRGSIELLADSALWAIEARNQSGRPLTSAYICGFTRYPNCEFDVEPTWDLDLDFLGPKPTPEEPQLPPEGSPTFKVLQLTDIHIDPSYMPGSSTECGEPSCCRFDQPAGNGSAGAGYWGDYHDCDTPLHAFEDMLQEAASRHPDIDYVIFTGDVIDHASWYSTIDYSTEWNIYAISEIARYFPSVPILNILGNHEAIPSNCFTDPQNPDIPANLDSTWLYQLSVDLWSPWLPPAAISTILQGGMYTIDIKPDLTVIAINSMSCLSYNWWLIYDNVDPYNQLIWLSEQLLQAETNNKKVHILAHAPNGFGECMHYWSEHYRRIIDRFENTVVAQFHGHTHRDHFTIFYDLNDPSRATNVAFTGGAATTFTTVNLNYRVYVVDGDYPGSSYRVLDHETWYYNLTEANLAGPDIPPNWQKLYSFNEAYGIISSLPAELDDLVHRMAQNVTLQQLYFEYYVKRGDLALSNGCDSACLQNNICDIVTSVGNDKSKCQELFP